MTEFTDKITPVVDKLTSFSAAELNLRYQEIFKSTVALKELLEDTIANTQFHRIENQPTYSTVSSFTIVKFDGTRWDNLDAVVPVGDGLPTYPLGLIVDVTGPSNLKTGKVYTSGLVKGLVASDILELGQSVQLGAPYYLSLTDPGKITTVRPAAGIFIGTFLSSSDFLLNFQFLSYSHVHRRSLLEPTSWIDNTTELLYPVSALSQLPLPFDGLVMVFDGQYQPRYGPYEVTTDGILITDIGYFETLLGVGPGNVFSTISAPGYEIEAFWTDPKTLSTPGVQKLVAGTDNIVISNLVPSQGNQSGSLKISNIPVLEKTETNTSTLVVKDINVDATTGTLQILRGPAVTSLEAGTNTNVSSPSGNVTISTGDVGVREQEFDTVYLKKALSKEIGDIGNYIEHPIGRTSGAIYKFVFPENVAEDIEAEVFVHYFCVDTQANEESTIFEVSQSVVAPGESFGAQVTPENVSVSYQIGLLITRIKFASIVPKANGILNVRIDRPKDSATLSAIGFGTVTIRYTLRG